MNVGIRVDASTTIGTGHVRRCLALADALRAHGHDVCFVLRDLGVAAAAWVQADGFATIVLPPVPAATRVQPLTGHAAWAGVDGLTDAAQTVEALAASPPQWLVIDHYSFDATWHRAAAAGLGCRIAAIDDLGDRPLDAAVVIDHNIANDHRAKYRGRVPESVPILGGPRFALLGRTYASAVRCPVEPRVRSVGVFMGGIDRGEYSAVALRALAAAGFAGDVELVSTSANPQLPALRELAGRGSRTRLSVDLPDLRAFFARHGLQIGAGGGATWERCCIGAPTLAAVVAANQRAALEPLAALGVLLLADEDPPTAASLARGLRLLLESHELRRQLAATSTELVDGRGAERVAAHLTTA